MPSGNRWARLRSSACFPGTQTNGLDFQKQPVPVGGAISTAQAQAFFGHLHQVDVPLVSVWRGEARVLGPGQFFQDVGLQLIEPGTNHI